MENYSRFITNYYKTHHEQLENNYPGLSIDRLIREFKYFSGDDEADINLDQYHGFFQSLADGCPLEYINKNAYFYKSNFYVDENVLIPRSETEILVEDSLNFIKRNLHSEFKMAEVGVGSFCVGLSILTELDQPIEFWGSDISTSALEVAKLNHFRLSSKIHPKSRVQLLITDRLQDCNDKFDFIVSNPPYISLEAHGELVHQQAHHFEPHVALYLKEAEYHSWFDELFLQSSEKLKASGAFFMEGHEDQLEELAHRAQKYFNKIELKDDYNHRKRFLHCYR